MSLGIEGAQHRWYFIPSTNALPHRKEGSRGAGGTPHGNTHSPPPCKQRVTRSVLSISALWPYLLHSEWVLPQVLAQQACIEARNRTLLADAGRTDSWRGSTALWWMDCCPCSPASWDTSQNPRWASRDLALPTTSTVIHLVAWYLPAVRRLCQPLLRMLPRHPPTDRATPNLHPSRLPLAKSSHSPPWA